MPRITPATTVGELLTAYPTAARVFIQRGMACVGCPIARFETIQGAAAAYSLELVPFMRDIEQACHARARRAGGTRRLRRAHSACRSSDSGV